MSFQHKDYVKAAKELNNLAGSTLKVVAIKGDVLKKSIKDLTPTLTDFDFSELSPEALDVLDDLGCDMPDFDTGEAELKEKTKKDNVVNMKEDTEQAPALIAAAADLIDVLNYDKEDIKKFEKLSFFEMKKELQKMADVINEPYKDDDGKEVTPDDKPEDFKPETIAVFEAQGIKVKWNSKKEKPAKKDKKKTEKKKEQQLQFHKYANLFPDMAEDDFNEIVKDMNENGFREDRPIILYGGKIADGKNRYKAANVAGIDAVYTNFDGTEQELFKHVIALNLKRRHLTPAQRATLAAELLPEFEKVGKEKQKAAGKGKKTEKAYRATEEAAKATGSTKDAVTTAKKVQKKDPKKFDEMKKGKKTIAAAKRETEEKTNEDKFNDSERMLKAKLKIAQTAIHEYFDAAELAEVKKIENENDLVFIDDTIQKIIE